jgi:hypothetical protein
MKKDVYLIAFILLFMCCKTMNTGLKHEKKIRSELVAFTYSQEIKDSLIEKRDLKNRVVFIMPLMVNEKKEGIYGFSRRGSHARMVNVFTYENGKIDIKSINDSSFINKFLADKGFPQDSILILNDRIQNIKSKQPGNYAF